MQRIVVTLCARRRRLARGVFAATLFNALAALLLSAQAPKSGDLPSPSQIGDVACAHDPSEGYSLYLPSSYDPTKKWPIIYFFDPGGHGRRPVELYKDLAEKYGFIFAGSNNSRNFSSTQSKSVNAVWIDTHERFALDEHRQYSSGFSGGARIAGAMAFSCPNCGVAAVIAHGAGYPTIHPTTKDNLSYFFAVGDKDFNWPEVMNVRREREEHGSPYRVRAYPGEHQWAPVPIMDEAMQWITLRAMQSSSLAPDAAFIDRMFAQRQAEADEAEKQKDALAQLSAYRSLVDDFTGLRDTKDAASKLLALKQSPGLKAALKAEQEVIASQYSLENEITPKLQAYSNGNVDDLSSLRIEIVQAIGRLRDQAQHAKSESSRTISSRAYGGVWVEGIETGQQEFENRHYEKAERCFDLMRQVSDDPWPALLLAETRAAMGNRKQALKDLQEAVRRGIKDPAVIDSDKKLEALKQEPEYQKLIAGMKNK
jgi:dienelactone hydrolase